MPRDFHLSHQDIASIGRAEDKDTWGLAENSQESVLLWAAQNPGKILYMHGQQPLQGTETMTLWPACGSNLQSAPTCAHAVPKWPAREECSHRPH